MAKKLPGDLGGGRSDVFKLNPLSENLIVDEKKHNFARWEPTDETEVRGLAEKIVQKAEENDLKVHGQLQPIKVRKIGADQYAVTMGFTRTKALRLINEDPDFRARLNLEDGEIYMLRAEVSNQNEEAAMLDNIDENFARCEPSPMDRSNVIMVLSAKGWSDKQISERFGWTANWVGQLKKLQNLEHAHQLMVHKGELPVQGAIDLIDVPEEDRAAVVEEAKKENASGQVKVNGAAIRSAKRDRAIQRAEENGTEADTKTALSMKELRKFVNEQAASEDNYDVVCEFWKKMDKFIAGKVSSKTITNAMNKLVETDFVFSEEEPAKEAA